MMACSCRFITKRECYATLNNRSINVVLSNPDLLII